MPSLRIVFAGTPEFGLPSLESLFHSRHEVVAVYSQPDRPSGRGRKLQASPIKQWAVERDIPVYQPLNFKDEQAREELAALKPDVMVVIAYGLILPQSVLDIPKLGCINVHASLLPRWRGASPIQQAILHGDSASGVTLMQMDAGMDTGDMLSQVSCSIDSKETASSLHDKLSAISANPLLDVLDQLSTHTAKPEPQNNALVTYAPKIAKDEAKIHWNQRAIEIDRQVRAFTPWPVAYTQSGDLTIRIHKAKIMDCQTPEKPGTIIDINRQHILVATAEQCLAIESLQFPGGKAISVSDWLNAGQQQLYVNKVFE